MNKNFLKIPKDELWILTKREKKGLLTELKRRHLILDGFGEGLS